MKKRKPWTIWVAFAACVLLIIVSMFLALTAGSIDISIAEIWQQITNPGDGTGTLYRILVNIRVPRILLALLIGAALAVSGCLLQAVMQNPLADPGIIGISSGASLAAIFVLIVFPRWASYLPVVAFLGGSAACILVYFLAWSGGIKPVRLVLAGVAVNALLGGAVALITILYSDKIQSVIQWTNGSLAGRTWKDLKMVAPYIGVGLLLSIFSIRSANIMMLGDEKAQNLGLNVSLTRIILSAKAAFLAAATTAVVGIIGFVGLVIPHIARLILGSDHKKVLPFSILLGGLFLLLTDTFARTIASPIELPVGTMMSIIGVPFFLYLLRRGEKR